LAAALKRDLKSVRRDVQKLERAGVLRDAGGDQSGAWAGEDCGAGGGEL
jgi:predicted transcriptional regulator